MSAHCPKTKYKQYDNSTFEITGQFVSAAPRYKIDEAFGQARSEVKTAHNRLGGLLNGNVRDDTFDAVVADAQEALQKALRHRAEYDRLRAIKKSEAWRYGSTGRGQE